MISYSKIFKKLYPLYNKCIGRDSYSIFLERLETQKLDLTELKKVQLIKLKKVLINAEKNVPFYKRKFQEIGFDPSKLSSLDDFEKLDFYVTKEDLKDNVEDFVATNCDRSKLSWHKTGGSTGVPLNFATDSATDAASASAIIRALNWWDVELGEKHAMFWGSPSHIERNIKDKFYKKWVQFKDRCMNRLFISNYDLNNGNMMKYYHQLELFKPRYIRGMASSLYVFSKYIIDNNLYFIHCKPVFIHSACEQLFDWQKVVIEEAFKRPVVNTYGLSELADIAYGAPCGNMHLLEEDVFVELKPFQDGQSEIIATQLNNLMTPLIKYRTGDIAESLETRDCCSLNLRVIENIKGRAHDFIKSEDGKFIHGQLFTHLMVYEKGIEKYQIVQHSITSIELVLVINSNFDKAVSETNLFISVKKYLGENVKIKFTYKDIIPLTIAGKHRWIISKIIIRDEDSGHFI